MVVGRNLILEKVGARRWIGRIMISWGLVSGAFVFTRGPISFIILRRRVTPSALSD
jgi:ACS family tartrate transporter-like MFS transporter